jgi:hypothetical protein
MEDFRIANSTPAPEDIQQDLEETRKKAYHQKQTILRRKFNNLKHLHPKPKPHPTQYKLDAVLNLSSRHLSQDEIKVLSLGFNFRPSLPNLPIKDYILATESYIHSSNIDPAQAATLRITVINEIEKIQQKLRYNPPKLNLSSRDWKAINALKTDDSIIIIPADKGNKTVVLDKQTYLDKLSSRITNHRQIQHDPTSQRESLINLALKDISSTPPAPHQKPSPKNADLLLSRSSIYKRFKVTYCSPAWLHGLLKAHKDDHPLREISDATNFPGHKLAKTLCQLFNKYVGNTSTSLKNGSEFVQLIRNSGRFNKSPTSTLVSFDAEKLYPSILVPEGLKILEHKLNHDLNSTIELTYPGKNL